VRNAFVRGDLGIVSITHFCAPKLTFTSFDACIPRSVHAQE
jgi:hypothetical protein